jgi:hypothetical protein
MQKIYFVQPFVAKKLTCCLGLKLSTVQGDQICRIFANWAIVYMGQVFSKITKVAQMLFII